MRQVLTNVCHATETMPASTVLHDVCARLKITSSNQRGQLESISSQLCLQCSNYSAISSALNEIQTIQDSAFLIIANTISDPQICSGIIPTEWPWVFNQERKETLCTTSPPSKCLWKGWEIADHKGSSAVKKRVVLDFSQTTTITITTISWCFLEMSSQKLNKALVTLQWRMRNYNLKVLNLW